jgi:hypothetical protein
MPTQQATDELIESIVSEVMLETGSEPDGIRLNIKTTEELGEILKPILEAKLHAHDQALRAEVITELDKITAILEGK